MSGLHPRAAAWIVFLLMVAVAGSVHAFTAGQIRAMKERSSDLRNARNRFLSRVLTGYNVPFRKDPATGTIRAIRVNGKWYPLRRIVIVPDTEARGDYLVVRGHHIYFYPEGQPYPFHLLSDLRIRIRHRPLRP